MTIETRLANFEKKHGFPGVVSFSGRSIHRRCINVHCGRATASLAQTECVHCEKRSGKWKGGKRTRAYEQHEVVQGEQEADETGSPVVVLDAVEVAQTVEEVLTLPRQRLVPRRPPPAEPGRYLRCRTKECDRIAKHRGTLCPKCWIAKDPDTRACPTCRKAPRCAGRKFGTCSSCNRNVERAAARLWQVSGGRMAIACSALAKHARDEDNAHEADQLLEAMASSERVGVYSDAEADAFGDSSL